jgi:hypothetical protein
MLEGMLESTFFSTLIILFAVLADCAKRKMTTTASTLKTNASRYDDPGYTDAGSRVAA